MKLLTFDVETVDKYLGLGLGSGWCYYLHHKDESMYKIVGYSYRTHDGFIEYTNDLSKIKGLLETHDGLIMHNSQYDAGALMALGHDISGHTIYDTMLMGKLLNNLTMASLDNLSWIYLKKRKREDALIDSVKNHDLFPWLKKELSQLNKRCVPSSKKHIVPESEETVKKEIISKRTDKAILKWAKTNMDLIPFEDMAIYGAADSDLTFQLFEKLLPLSNKIVLDKYSTLIHSLLESRARGVRIDLNQCSVVSSLLTAAFVKATKDLYAEVGQEFNVSSPQEVANVAKKMGVRLPPTSSGKGESAAKDVLERLTDPWARMLLDVRKIVKLKRDFIDKIMKIQQYTWPQAASQSEQFGYGRVFPEFKIHGARTGRFSCSSPNIQQIPARRVKGSATEKFVPLCRSIFVPEEGETWYSLDFSNQEGRIQVHCAGRLKLRGINRIIEEFKKNPKFDMHQEVANMAKIDRDQAKTINLGLSYGMGRIKLANSLNLTEEATNALLDKYHTNVPFMKDLTNKFTNSMSTNGYVLSMIMKTKIRLEPPKRIKIFNHKTGRYEFKNQSFEYKALNGFVQRAAAEQTTEAIIYCHKMGINLLFSVHDELNFSAKDDTIAEKVKDIMEHSLQLDIPSLTEISKGASWGHAKFGEIKNEQVLV